MFDPDPPGMASSPHAGLITFARRPATRDLAGVDIAALVNRHRAQLKLGGHPNKVLQGDWNALGADQFAFEVVDTLPVPETADVDQRDDVAALEALWLEKLAPFEPAGYNRAPRPRG